MHKLSGTMSIDDESVYLIVFVLPASFGLGDMEVERHAYLVTSTGSEIVLNQLTCRMHLHL